MADEVKTTEVETTKEVTGTTKFGFGQIRNATPQWATWAFRVFFYITSTVSLGLTMFTNIPTDVKLTVMEIITFANVAIHGLSKMVGVDNSDENIYKK